MKSQKQFFSKVLLCNTYINKYHCCVIQNHLSVFLSLCTKLNNVQSMNLISTQWSMLYMRPLGHLESDLKSFPNAIPIPKLIPPNLPHHVWDFSSSQTLHCYHWSLITHLLSIWMSFLCTITISQFIFATKEVKSRLHYLNEDFMNFQREEIFGLNHNFLNIMNKGSVLNAWKIEKRIIHIFQVII